jgi:hypothetical protein
MTTFLIKLRTSAPHTKYSTIRAKCEKGADYKVLQDGPPVQGQGAESFFREDLITERRLGRFFPAALRGSPIDGGEASLLLADLIFFFFFR